MVDFCFYKIINTKTFFDNSKLIQGFYDFAIDTIPDFLGWFVLIGKTFGSMNMQTSVNFSFPTGKIKYGETSQEFAYREFEEETGVELDENLISAKNQLSQRELYGLDKLPLEIIVSNFLLKIIII